MPLSWPALTAAKHTRCRNNSPTRSKHLVEVSVLFIYLSDAVSLYPSRSKSILRIYWYCNRYANTTVGKSASLLLGSAARSDRRETTATSAARVRTFSHGRKGGGGGSI